MLVKLPAGAEPVAVASVADNVADGYRSVRDPLARAPGAEVLVVGGSARSVGLYAAACAVALGSRRVFTPTPTRAGSSRPAPWAPRPLAGPADDGGSAEWPASRALSR